MNSVHSIRTAFVATDKALEATEGHPSEHLLEGALGQLEQALEIEKAGQEEADD